MSLAVIPLAITMNAGPQIMSAIIFVTANKPLKLSAYFLVLQCHLYETTHWILHVARLSRSQRVAKVIKPCCKVPKTEPAEPT
jgi:small neutral amino acid transporter SnatA (MarC family)